MIHTSDPCGLKSDPAGGSAIRCEVLPANRRLGLAGWAVASTAAETVTSGPTTPAEVLFPAVMVSLASMSSPGVYHGCALARYFDRFQYRVDDLTNLDSFHLEIRPQEHTVLQYGASQGLYVLGRHEIAVLESRKRPRRRQ